MTLIEHSEQPWLRDPQYGGMSAASAEASWRAAEQQRESRKPAVLENDDGPYGPEAYGLPTGDFEPEIVAHVGANPLLVALSTTTPSSWLGTIPQEQRWLVQNRIPRGDLTIYAGNGGSGKTETIIQLNVAVAAGLTDWLGAVVENGKSLFLSCEEPEANVRDRVERYCKHRSLDPHTLTDFHMFFPDLTETWLISEGKSDRMAPTSLFVSLEAWVKEHRPALVTIDSIAAVYDGDALKRRQVRRFLAMLRKLARETDAAIVLLDHPSVRGQQDNSGTANSVDWRNSVRSMMLLSDPDRDDPDVRELSIVKSNRGRIGEKIRLRWNGLTFSTEADSLSSPQRAATHRTIDDLFLKLLDKRNAQQRPVRPGPGRGYAPSEFADDPDAAGTNTKAFKASMERLYASGSIVTVVAGPNSRQTQHIERAPSP